MKKEERVVYLELSNEIGCQLCIFCKHPSWEEDGCCEGYPVCEHPLQAIVDREEDSPLEPGSDCWGFYPSLPLQVCVDIVGAIISQDYWEWEVRLYSKTAVTVYGRSGNDKTSKVRIGHNGKPENEPKELAHA